MGYTTELKPHEKILHNLCLDKGLDKLILSLLGLSDLPISEHKDSLVDIEKNKISDNLKLDLTAEDITRLPKIQLNASTITASGEWSQEGNHLRISSHPEYLTNLQKGIDHIFPDNKRDLSLIPITLLLPSSVTTDGENLVGKKCSWDFIKVNNESTDEALGFSDLACDTSHLYGLRLFTALKFLGMAKTNHGKRNAPQVFPNLLRASNLNKHFNLLKSSDIREHSKVDTAYHHCIKQLITLDNKFHKVKSDIKEQKKKVDRLKESIEAVGYRKIKLQTKEDKISKLNERVNKLQVSLEKLNLELISLPQRKKDKEDVRVSLEKQMKSLDPIRRCNNINDGFFYSIPPEHIRKNNPTTFRQSQNNSKDNKSKKFILPTVNSHFELPDFVTNTTEINYEKPAPLDMKRMKFGLSYLFSMTNGTAVTFYVDKAKTQLKGDKFQGIDAPLLILPRIWNELVLGAKLHDPKNKTREYKYTSEENFREMCIAAIHTGLHHKIETLSREIPYISNISVTKRPKRRQ